MTGLPAEKLDIITRGVEIIANLLSIKILFHDTYFVLRALQSCCKKRLSMYYAQ